MNYVKYFSLLVLSPLCLPAMQFPEASLLEEINDSPRKIASYSPSALRFKNLSNNLEEHPITSVPVISEDFNIPIDELPIVQNIQPSSSHNSPATTPVKGLYSRAVHNFETTVQKKLFQEMATGHDAPISIPVAFSIATQASALASSSPMTAQTVVVPWTESTRKKKLNPYDKSLMIITATPSFFTGAQPGTRIGKKAKKILIQPAQTQDNINLNHSPEPVSELPPKQLVQVKGLLRTKKPEHGSMAQFSLMGPKKRKSRLSLKNCESLKKVETQHQ